MNLNHDLIKEIENFSKRIRKNILDVSFKGGAERAHIGGALSSADIISVLYGSIMNIDKKNPNRYQ